MSQQFPTTEEEWRTHVLNIHGTPFEQICEHHLRHAPDWTFRSSRYPVEFPPSYSPQVSQTKNSELDLWGNCFSSSLKIELLVECKKNNPEYTDWVFFPTTNPAPTFPSIRGVKYSPPQTDPIHPWTANSHILYLVPPTNIPITGDGREIKGDYQTRSQQNQNSGKQLIKTSNAAITEAAYQIALPPILQIHLGEHQWIYRTDAQWEELARFAILVVQSAAFPELLTHLSKMTKDDNGRLVLSTL